MRTKLLWAFAFCVVLSGAAFATPYVYNTNITCASIGFVNGVNCGTTHDIDAFGRDAEVMFWRDGAGNLEIRLLNASTANPANPTFVLTAATL